MSLLYAADSYFLARAQQAFDIIIARALSCLFGVYVSPSAIATPRQYLLHGIRNFAYEDFKTVAMLLLQLYFDDRSPIRTVRP
jgi:hypothetical protein